MNGSSAHNLFKRIELAANITIIAVSLLLGFVLVKKFLLHRAESDRQPLSSVIRPGAKISLPQTDWSLSERHLVLVLQKGCHFCTESAPFYQRLTQAAGTRKDLELIAALPQSVSEGKQYLDGLGVPIAEVKQADPSSVGATGTPTLLLVDRNGTVTDVWVGKLTPDKEREVFNRLQLKS
jgi:hypothetical protein